LSRRCTVCVRGDRAAIDAALLSGTSAIAAAQVYRLGVDAVERHRKRHVQPATVPPSVATAAPAATVEPLALESPQDLVEVQRRLVRHSLATLEAAIASGDNRLQLQANKDCHENLIALGRSYGMFRDETVVNVNVDASTRKLELAIAGMTTDELRAVLRGDIRLALPGGDA
jgi:hypothetical protein